MGHLKNLLFYKLSAILLCLFIANFSVLAKDLNAKSFIFQNLSDAEYNLEFSTKNVAQKQSVWIVFQKGCPTCHKMMKESACYDSKTVDVLALGLYESPKDLLKDARDNGYKGTVLTSKNAVDVEQNLSVTPTTFIFNKNKLLRKLETYADCKTIKSILKNKS